MRLAKKPVIRDESASKRCYQCKATKPVAAFHRDGGRRDGSAPLCKQCMAAYAKEWWQRNIEVNRTRQRANAKRHYAKDPMGRRLSARKARLKKEYGLTVEDYEAMEIEQQGLCAICQRTCDSGRRLAVDHDHVTGLVRQLLCARCNGGIGQFRHDTELLTRAIAYLATFAA